MCQPKLLNLIDFNKLDASQTSQLEAVKRRLQERKDSLQKTIDTLDVTLLHVIQGLEQIEKKSKG